MRVKNICLWVVVITCLLGGVLFAGEDRWEAKAVFEVPHVPVERLNHKHAQKNHAYLITTPTLLFRAMSHPAMRKTVLSRSQEAGSTGLLDSVDDFVTARSVSHTNLIEVRAWTANAEFKDDVDDVLAAIVETYRRFLKDEETALLKREKERVGRYLKEVQASIENLEDQLGQNGRQAAGGGLDGSMQASLQSLVHGRQVLLELKQQAIDIEMALREAGENQCRLVVPVSPPVPVKDSSMKSRSSH